MNIKDMVNKIKADIEQPHSHNLGSEVIVDVCTTQPIGQGLLTEAINYWLSEALVFAHAIACVEIVLLRSDEANTIYREIVQAWGLPGCQNLLEATSPYIPNPAELFIESIRANEKKKHINHTHSQFEIQRQPQVKAKSEAISQAKLHNNGNDTFIAKKQATALKTVHLATNNVTFEPEKEAIKRLEIKKPEKKVDSQAGALCQSAENAATKSNAQSKIATDLAMKGLITLGAEIKSGRDVATNQPELQTESQSKLESGGYSKDLYADLKLWLQSDKFKQISEHPDYQYLVKQINKLILVGFNRKIDQDNQDWKVTSEAPPYLLIAAISLQSMAEYGKIRLQNLIQIKVQVNDKLYNFDSKMPRDPSTRKERQIRRVLIKAFKHDSFVLRHDTKLLKDADQWYQSRVVYSGPEEYCRKLYKKTGIFLDPRNVGNEIKPYDYATGYPRRS